MDRRYHWPAVAFMRLRGAASRPRAVARRIRAAIAEQDEPELADARVIRGMQDVAPEQDAAVTVQDLLPLGLRRLTQAR